MTAILDDRTHDGADLDPDAMPDEASFLAAYKKKEYPKPGLTVDIAVFRLEASGLEVLMVRRGNHPFRGCWALPGGFVNPDEDVVDAAARELEEETGLHDVPAELFGVYGAPGRDPRGWTVSIGYCTVLDGKDDERDVRAGDDAADAQWCAVCVRENAADARPAGADARPAVAGADTGPAGAEAGTTPSAIELEIRCGAEDALFTRFELIAQRFDAPRAHVIASEGFAFDHAQLLADAYLKIRQALQG